VVTTNTPSTMLRRRPRRTSKITARPNRLPPSSAAVPGIRVKYSPSAGCLNHEMAGAFFESVTQFRELRRVWFSGHDGPHNQLSHLTAQVADHIRELNTRWLE